MVWGISKAVILTKTCDTESSSIVFLGGNLGCFVLVKDTQISVKKLQTCIAGTYHIVIDMCSKKIKTSGFLILGLGFDGAVLYDKASASVIHRQ